MAEAEADQLLEAVVPIETPAIDETPADAPVESTPEAEAVEEPAAEKEPAAEEEAASDPEGTADAEAVVEASEAPGDEISEDETTDEQVADETADEPAAETSPATTHEGAAPQEPALIEADEPAAEPTPRRRRKRAVITEVVAEPEASEPLPEPLSLDELPRLDDLAPRPAEQRGRRRRREPEAPVAEPEAPVADAEASSISPEQPEAEADPVAESLAELSRARGRKRAKKTETEAAAVLDELAAAIGAQRDDEAADASEDEEPAAVVLVVSDELVETDEADDQGDGADDGDDSGEGPRRRRRRRGGRRRRRGGAVETTDDEAGDDSSDDEADTDGEASAADAEGETEAAGESAEGGESGGSSRRRRRRRRRGEDTTGSDDDPTDVVVRVRQPRRSKASDEVTGIDGSTRMEAKRQRRREGRAAGRRRSPILSEAEFLARREAVDRKMLIRQADDYTQIAVLEDNILVEHYVDRASANSMIGNVYLGKVQNVLPSMEAAFIDIGRGRNAVLYAGEVDWETFGVTGGDRKMEKVFKSGQSVLVQVTKDPIGAKGARLTGHVSIPGRYVVYSPGGQLSGISRKLPEGERTRLKGILDELVGDTASVIVRTAAEGASEEELVRDVNRLKAQWEVIEKRVKAGKSPELLYAEPDLTVRIVRDLFTEDFGRLVVDGNGKGEDAWDTVDAYVTHVAPHLKERLEHWDREESGDLFAANRIDEQIAKALERKVFLPSGGSLIIDRTEAMTVIDVNTGKFTGTSGNLEATVTSNNLEAAEEIVRQLRLRDIGGIIVVDFIDMVLPANRELLLRRLVECLGRDRTRHQVAEVTSLGLVQMTRKKIGTGLAEAFTVTCETCHGRGYHRHDTPVDSQAPADGGEREHGRRRRH
ncbi:Rne/Rng family ribonuclease [Micropruina sp.]|uniref:Rne/Rng family ribonuclease n=1 Tax=Micropruina sp. TaxID=2737536 RepID=UPI0039E5D17D